MFGLLLAIELAHVLTEVDTFQSFNTSQPMAKATAKAAKAESAGDAPPAFAVAGGPRSDHPRPQFGHHDSSPQTRSKAAASSPVAPPVPAKKDEPAKKSASALGLLRPEITSQLDPGAGGHEMI